MRGFWSWLTAHLPGVPRSDDSRASLRAELELQAKRVDQLLSLVAGLRSRLAELELRTGFPHPSQTYDPRWVLSLRSADRPRFTRDGRIVHVDQAGGPSRADH
jgi:hypothetical protein